MDTTTNTSIKENLEFLIRGVATLRGPGGPTPQRPNRELAALEQDLISDLIVFRRASGLASFAPETRKEIASEGKINEAESRERINVLFRSIWKRIHSRALLFDPSSVKGRTIEENWLNQGIPELLSCHTCRDDYKAYLTANPPVLDSVDSYFDWTVKLHNHVNIKLGKPTLTIDQARPLYKT